MRIFLTGANGYIGMRLLPQLLEQGHEVICTVRNRKRFTTNDELKNKVEIVEIDFLEDSTAPEEIRNIDTAFYLIHSMTGSTKDFDKQEATSAENFKKIIAETSVNQVIYLSGIINEEKLSKHLQSRKKVEEMLYQGNFNLTVLRAAIIVGSGSSSFSIKMQPSDPKDCWDGLTGIPCIRFIVSLFHF